MSGKITRKDIARLSNTSKTTVSFYLNGRKDKMSLEVQERIRKVIEKYNYRPNALARSLNAKSMKLIGVIIGDITNSFANQIVKGIDFIAKKQKYQLIVGNSDYNLETERQYVEHMLAMGVDGFIVQPTIHFDEIEKLILNHDRPIVYIDSQIKNNKGLWVKTNNYEAVMEVTEDLIKRGYEEFILITAEPGILTTRMDRASGFEDTLNKNNKKYYKMIVDNDTGSEEINQFINSKIDLNKRTCIFAPNCWVLPKVFMALKDMRKYIPDKIGLIGFDNLEWTDFSAPTVATIVQPAFQEGKHAARILIDAIEKLNEEAPNQVLRCSFNIGESIR